MSYLSYTRKAHTTLPSGVVNDGGAVINAGATSNSPITKNLSSTDDKIAVHGSKISLLSDDVVGIGMGGAKLNTVASIGELYEEQRPVEVSIHKTLSDTFPKPGTAFRSGEFNLFTGEYSPGLSGGNTLFANAVNGETPIDQAAHPTRSVPGELTFSLGTAKPSGLDYEAKNG